MNDEQRHDRLLKALETAAWMNTRDLIHNYLAARRLPQPGCVGNVDNARVARAAHKEMSDRFTAMLLGKSLSETRRHHREDCRKVHNATTGLLLNRLREIGFDPHVEPDDGVHEQFFLNFLRLAQAVLWEGVVLPEYEAVA